jgi:hypothetical protein
MTEDSSVENFFVLFTPFGGLGLELSTTTTTTSPACPRYHFFVLYYCYHDR